MMKNPAIFLSHPIDKFTPLYRGQSLINITQLKSIKKGDSSNSMIFSFPNHTGTHVDTPLHFFAHGKGILDYSPKDWVFSPIVMVSLKNIRPGEQLSFKSVPALKDCELLLLRTGFEKFRRKDTYWQNSPVLQLDFCIKLKKKCPSIKAIGVDFISIANINHRELGRTLHKALLSRDIRIIEDMKLSCIKKIPDSVVVAPVLVRNSDAAPCTAIGIYN